MRWAKYLGIPIHHASGGRHARVYFFRSEILFWMARNSSRPISAGRLPTFSNAIPSACGPGTSRGGSENSSLQNSPDLPLWRAFLAPLETVHGLSPRAAIQIRLTSKGCTLTFAIPLLPQTLLPLHFLHVSRGPRTPVMHLPGHNLNPMWRAPSGAGNPGNFGQKCGILIWGRDLKRKLILSLLLLCLASPFFGSLQARQTPHHPQLPLGERQHLPASAEP